MIIEFLWQSFCIGSRLALFQLFHCFTCKEKRRACWKEFKEGDWEKLHRFGYCSVSLESERVFGFYSHCIFFIHSIHTHYYAHL